MQHLPGHIKVIREVVQCDASGRGGVLLRSFGDEAYSVQRGDSVAQVLLQKPDNLACFKVNDADDVKVTEAKPVHEEFQLPRAAPTKAPKGPAVNPHSSPKKCNIPLPNELQA